MSGLPTDGDENESMTGRARVIICKPYHVSHPSEPPELYAERYLGPWYQYWCELFLTVVRNGI